MSKILNVGDEEAFLSYAEKVVHDMQNLWKRKEGMEYLAVIDMSAKLEELVYNESLTSNSLSLTALVWAKKECIMYYQETCDKMLKNLEFKQLNWKKLFEDNEKSPKNVLAAIMKDDDGYNKPKFVSVTQKTMKLPRQSKAKTTGRASTGSEAKKGTVKSSASAATGNTKDYNSQFSAPVQPVDNMHYRDPIDLSVAASSDSMLFPERTRLERLISESSIDGLGFDFDGDDNILGDNFGGEMHISNEQDWYNIA